MWMEIMFAHLKTKIICQTHKTGFPFVPDVANADKAVGKYRRYKIIFTPRKVRLTLQLILV